MIGYKTKQTMIRSIRRIYNKSIILRIIIEHKKVTSGIIEYRLKQDYNICLSHRTMILYLRELVQCGQVKKYVLLSDTRKYWYCLPKERFKE